MLNVLATSSASQGKEQESAFHEVQISPLDNGEFGHPELMGGVSIETISSDQEGAVLNIHFMRGQYDAWIGGIQSGSMIKWAISQIASNLLNGKHLPSDFDQRITLTDFHLPTGTEVKFSIMLKPSTADKDKSWKKLSDIRLSYTSEVSA